MPDRLPRSGWTRLARRPILCTRGIDNVDDPNENDGKIYVYELG